MLFLSLHFFNGVKQHSKVSSDITLLCCSWIFYLTHMFPCPFFQFSSRAPHILHLTFEAVVMLASVSKTGALF
ncbi:hypothetical protein XELAEV_18005927mg [Xenopus laevis]|uniref:Uncharacterized protein n=1 Tax=Xenopus laevis TaxID=8355 RepID=A0A974I3V7_XENLA|nr:hypothetical protein XELAEV_18005927mg [Xenopus laevis]